MCACYDLQFKQTLEALGRSGGSSPKLSALVQTLREHFTVSLTVLTEVVQHAARYGQQQYSYCKATPPRMDHWSWIWPA
jgi:hypothetical protein